MKHFHEQKTEKNPIALMSPQKMAAITWSGLTTCLVQDGRTEVVCTDGQTRRDGLSRLPGNHLQRRA